MILAGQRCPACHRLDLVVENDRESCDRCHYTLDLDDRLAEPTHAPSRRDQDESWGEAASTFVRDLDEQRMTRPGE